MLSRDPVERSSRTITLQPSAIRRSQRCEPRNPAPPVTSAVVMGGRVWHSAAGIMSAIAIIGAGGHAKVVLSVALELGLGAELYDERAELWGSKILGATV